ncbi:MAG TPA: methyltransferase domain-containing protein [Natronosporangium sp.]|nr:methyltransferase domain-containing protein [Natronosporangium sp.]
MDLDPVQERVRQAYAAAARAASAGRAACCGDPAAPAGRAACCGDPTTPAGPAARGGDPTAPAGPAVTGEPAGPGCGCGTGSGGDAGAAGAFGAGRYSDADRAELAPGVLEASLGCGNPLAVADLRPGDTVLDLGSGAGGDVLLSARRVGPAGRVYGLDMTEEMRQLARANAARARVTNVEVLAGTIERVPLPDASVDVVISNCVINLSVDKPAVFAEMFRVLRPGGRVGVADIVADDALTPAQRAERGEWTACIAGALTRSEYVEGLTAAGFTRVDVSVTHRVADGMYAAIVTARRPADAAVS